MTDQLAYEETGAGRPLVFLHGITANRHHWDPVVEQLSGGFRCVNVDLLAHGQSPRDESADLFSQVTALIGLLDHLEIEEPVLVGHSFGGFIATFTATARAVRGVVNVDQRLDTAEFKATLAPFEARLRGDDFPAAFLEITDALGAGLVPAARRDLVDANSHPQQDVVLEVWGSVLDTPAAELAAQVRGALPAVTVPYLAVFGADITDEERSLQALIPNATVEVWDGLGHFIHLVDPDRTARRLAAFAGSLP